MPTLSSRALLPLVVMTMAGCPTAPATEADKAVAVAEAKEAAIANDPRIARDGDDLYPDKTLNPPGLAEPEAGAKPGSGKPDETNGVCRLYAPKLPEPECCKDEFGFDAEALSEACNLPLYLGESFHFSCGYYFHRSGQQPAWFRMSFVPGANVDEAAASHDRRMQHLTTPEFHSTAVPGVAGAKWSFHDGLAWAFVPGWDRVRQFAWREEFCDRDAVAKAIGSLAAAKAPPADSPGSSLVPKSRAN